MTSSVEQRLKQHGYEIPTAPEAIGFYVPVLRTGNLVMTSGQLPLVGKELMFKGKVGKDLHENEAANAARMCALTTCRHQRCVRTSRSGIWRRRQTYPHRSRSQRTTD
jgi:enamine deaminase RidA (YjgF/YER057c/UK114 family)